MEDNERPELIECERHGLGKDNVTQFFQRFGVQLPEEDDLATDDDDKI